jgi:hypothetical protein
MFLNPKGYCLGVKIHDDLGFSPKWGRGKRDLPCILRNVINLNSCFKHYLIIPTCLLKPADKLATVSLLLESTSCFFGRIIPFENSVNKNWQLNSAINS